MRFLLFIIISLLSFFLKAQEYTLDNKMIEYKELTDKVIICKDTIPRHKYFLLENPITLFNEEIDSIFILDWNVLHIGLGNKKSSKFDLFTPLNCPIKRVNTADNPSGFTIGYKITGELGRRKLIIQWQGVKPNNTFNPNDAINLQVIIDEENNTITYAYGKLLPFLELVLSVWTNNRQLALYFVDNLESFNETDFEVKYIAKNSLAPFNYKVNTAYFTGGPFDDIYVSSKTPYDLDGIELVEGLNFIIGEVTNSVTFEQDRRKINIYPNPASQVLFIDKENLDLDEIKIIDQSGKVILNSKFKNDVPIYDLTPGLYFMSFYDDNLLKKTLSFYKK